MQPHAISPLPSVFDAEVAELSRMLALEVAKIAEATHGRGIERSWGDFERLCLRGAAMGVRGAMALSASGSSGAALSGLDRHRWVALACCGSLGLIDPRLAILAFVSGGWQDGAHANASRYPMSAGWRLWKCFDLMLDDFDLKKSEASLQAGGSEGASQSLAKPGLDPMELFGRMCCLPIDFHRRAKQALAKHPRIDPMKALIIMAAPGNRGGSERLREGGLGLAKAMVGAPGLCLKADVGLLAWLSEMWISQCMHEQSDSAPARLEAILSGLRPFDVGRGILARLCCYESSIHASNALRRRCQDTFDIAKAAHPWLNAAMRAAGKRLAVSDFEEKSASLEAARSALGKICEDDAFHLAWRAVDPDLLVRGLSGAMPERIADWLDGALLCGQWEHAVELSAAFGPPSLVGHAWAWARGMRSRSRHPWPGDPSWDQLHAGGMEFMSSSLPCGIDAAVFFKELRKECSAVFGSTHPAVDSGLLSAQAAVEAKAIGQAILGQAPKAGLSRL